MEIIYSDEAKKKSDIPCVVCLGFFDGVHKGHMALIKRGRAEAKKRGLAFCMHTFDTPPTNDFGVPLKREITPLPIKAQILEKEGAQILYVDYFTPEFKAMSPSQFVEEVLHERIHAKVVIAGFHYTFGKGGKGDTKTLLELCQKKGIEFMETAPVLVGDEIAASRRIREYIGQGDMERAAFMLGRPYYIQSPVLSGQKIGRTIDFPTINQDFPPFSIIPALGAYFTRTIAENKTYYSITSVGKRPTVGDFSDIRVETHIFDFSGNLYGKEVRVEFLKKIREEIKFESFEALQEQLKKDMALARMLEKEARNREKNSLQE